jgi:hypothetical protein
LLEKPEAIVHIFHLMEKRRVLSAYDQTAHLW